MKQERGIKPSVKTAREIIGLITPEFLEPIIKDTGVDFHCRKLFGEVFLKPFILCQLLTSKGSQRKAAAVYSSELFGRLVPKAGGTLTHTAVSRHLAACDADFFERAYFKLLGLAGPEPRGVFGGAAVCSVDSAMVRAVSGFISGREAMRVGAPGEGGMRPQIKYTMITDGISALYTRLHTLPAYLSEDKALYEAVMEYAAPMSRRGPDRGERAREVFAFDRGLKGTTHLATMAGEGISFVGRVATTRSFADAGGRPFPPRATSRKGSGSYLTRRSGSPGHRPPRDVTAGVSTRSSGCSRRTTEGKSDGGRGPLKGRRPRSGSSPTSPTRL